MGGEAVGVNTEPRFATDNSDDITAQRVCRVLEETRLCFEGVHRLSSRYSPPADSRGLTHSELTPVARNLHSRMEDIVHQRQKRGKLLEKASQALYSNKYLDQLIGDIAGLVGNLENLYPVQMQRRRFVGLEMEAVDDDMSLSTLKNAGSGTDGVLSEVVTNKMQAIADRTEAITGKLEATATRNEPGKTLVEEMERIRVGNEWSESVLNQGALVMDRTENKALAITARGGATIHIGSSFGRRSIFD
ncbi:uncharacterized protein NECHADRAFT_82003 [Fusarium vanettenii 77-13-4]|uniref:Uncharacterized protein n=1 Tax=Fusarium vanettenii (strain ATCC MYA-4622 / CBS 123669 / FGSC 9596 / NRRL 45880 / 77-13-4) TaxID=660122 RepID=C7ZA77_FUSV7|nr:uncharacterized protein NECHADRAFT_82003 [Fusarium vanettenii 77-13-4]EEU39630.1 hypothetical protein NECHADRAFT_82003 [Fusarium vanettenii 77-13-4]